MNILRWFSRASLSVMLFALGAQAADTTLKIGIVNTERLFRESQMAQRIDKKLQEEFGSRDAELQKGRGRVRELQNALERKGNPSSEAEKVKRENELRLLNTQLQRQERAFREDLAAKQNEVLINLQTKASEAIHKLAAEEKFDLIFQRQDLAHASDRIDVTDKVLKLMNEK